MNAKMPVGSKRKRGRWNLISSLLIAVILYIGIHLLVRTDGMRQLVTDKISNWTKSPVLITNCRATPLLSIRLEGVEFPGVSILDVRVKINPLAVFSKTMPLVKALDVRGVDVKLRQIPASNKWEPLVLSNMGNRLGAVVGVNPSGFLMDNTLPQFPAKVLNSKTIFLLERAKVTWRDARDNELAYVSGVDSTVKVVAFSDRKAMQTRLTCGHIKMASGKMLRDVELETVKIEGYAPVLILKLTDSNGEYDGFQTKELWLDLSVRLDALSKIQ